MYWYDNAKDEFTLSTDEGTFEKVKMSVPSGLEIKTVLCNLTILYFWFFNTNSLVYDI